jgi:hypothetical protein
MQRADANAVVATRRRRREIIRLVHGATSDKTNLTSTCERRETEAYGQFPPIQVTDGRLESPGYMAAAFQLELGQDGTGSSNPS